MAEPPLNNGIEALLRAQLKDYFAAHEGRLPPDGLYARMLGYFERPLLQETLLATQGNQLHAAKLLGINRNTLRKKLRERGLIEATLPRRHIKKRETL